MILVQLAPLAGTVVTLAVRRGRMLEAGLVGLGLAVPVAALVLNPRVPFTEFLIDSAARGCWLAGQVIPVILAGLLFFELTQTRSATAAAGTLSAIDPRQLWFGCFLLGPFCEAATGVGVGLVILIPFLRRLGLSGGSLLVFGLFSQILVPWGALAIGTVLGAQIGHVPLETMGVASAWLSAPMLMLYLMAFWWLRLGMGRKPKPGECLDDFLWTAALWALLLLANHVLPVDTAGLAASGALMLLRFLRDRRGVWKIAPATAREVAPYAILTFVLLVVRGIPAVSTWLGGLVAFRPFPDLAPFAVFQHASFWLAAVALSWGALAPGESSDWRRVGKQLLARAWRPVTVSLVFVIMGEILARAGISQSLAGEMAGALGIAALAVGPWIAAAAGFLTGTNVASNAMLVPMQAALAAMLAIDWRWFLALQNIAGANFTLLSPIRVAMGAALAGDAAAGRIAAADAYRRLAPLAVAMLALVAAMGLSLKFWN